jgi:serine phosphatase RsbU (regulator of sigma subunit)
MEVWGDSQLTSRRVEFGGLEVWVYSKPHGEAQRGGDVYYASSCATGRISRFVLAAVAGHGNSVAATAADLRTLMRRFVNRLDQTEFVRLLNQQFLSVSRAEAFATAIVTTFFAPTRGLTVCNAGHPRPLLYRARHRTWECLGDQGTAEQSKSCNIPLGIIEVSDYEQFEIELECGDYVVIYTDALIESCDEDGEMLGEAGLLRTIRLLGHLEPQNVIQTLLGAIVERCPENLCDDDVTVLMIRANERPPHYSLGERLRALGRFFRQLIAAAINPRAERAPFPDANLANIGGAIIPALGRRRRATRTVRRAV